VWLGVIGGVCWGIVLALCVVRSASLEGVVQGVGLGAGGASG